METTAFLMDVPMDHLMALHMGHPMDLLTDRLMSAPIPMALLTALMDNMAVLGFLKTTGQKHRQTPWRGTIRGRAAKLR